MDQNQEIRAIFQEEACDLLERVRGQLDRGLAADLNDVFRSVHTIKGGAGTCELVALKESAHRLENRLAVLRDGREPFDDAALEYLRKGIDELESLLEGQDVPATSEAPANDAFGFFDEAPSAPAPTPAPSSVPAATTAQAAKGEARAATEVLRVPVERVQKNCEIASEIFLARNQIYYLVDQYRQGLLARDEFFQRWEILDGSLRKSANELESVAMSMRMMPARMLLRRMEKTVRSYLETSTGKDIRFEAQGEDIELDKAVLDSLAEPLIHLTRNAMDHGVETAQERRAVGKSPQAKITLSVALEGNEVVIEVRDDGKGIDDQKVLAAARSKGLDVSHVRTRQDAIELIFLPGFSTAKAVSDVSGRGIGMDAVKTYAETAGGSVAVYTEPGRGSTFTLRLPLAISVVQAVLATANGQKFAISSADLIETRKVSYKEVQTNGSESFFIRNGECIPCYDVERYIYRQHRESHGSDQRREYCLCVVRTKGETVALCVPELLGNAEIAVRSLPDAAGGASYVAGVAILATGEPTFVLSLSRLYERTIKPGRSGAPEGEADVAA